MIKAAFLPSEAGNGESGSAQIFCHPDMRAVLIEVRLPVSRISLLFIERPCLLLGMENHTPAAQHADLRFCGGQHTGAEAVPAVLFSDGDPSDDIFPLRMPLEKAACRGGIPCERCVRDNKSCVPQDKDVADHVPAQYSIR